MAQEKTAKVVARWLLATKQVDIRKATMPLQLVVAPEVAHRELMRWLLARMPAPKSRAKVRWRLD